MKTPIVNREHFIIYLEEVDGFIFIHCDVLSKWTKTIKKELQEEFDKITKKLNTDLFALHTPNDNKHIKFLKMFGFTWFKNIKGIDNNYYDIYVWR
jgi:hypothetical protein